MTTTEIVEIMQQAQDDERLRRALALIADIADGSTTANSLPHIARRARDALRRQA